MGAFKTYTAFNKTNNAASFGIARMEDIYRSNEGKSDEPHSHDYYTSLVVKKGNGKHIIDFNEFNLTNTQIHFINPRQVPNN